MPTEREITLGVIRALEQRVPAEGEPSILGDLLIALDGILIDEQTDDVQRLSESVIASIEDDEVREAAEKALREALMGRD